MIRFTYLASALSLAAAAKKKASKPTTPSPKTLSPKTAKTIPASMSLQAKSSKTGANYIIAPFSCPRDCIGAHGLILATMELDDAVTTCDASDEDQMWKVHQFETYIKFESAAHNDGGMCLAVIDDNCNGENLGLADCEDARTYWYNTGGQFFSTYCWEQSTPAVMSTDCTDLTVEDTSGLTLTTSETFMLLGSD